MSKVKFNEQQLQAIQHFEGACGVLSSAGSGKSTVLLNRIKNLIENHNVPEKDILTITFTRNTADELKGKLIKMGYLDVHVGTFHSICGRILSQEGKTITSYNLVKDWQVENWLKTIDKKVDVNDVRSFIGYQKNYMRKWNDEFVLKDSNYTEDELRNYYKLYEDKKNASKLYDFDDYLLNCYDILLKNKHKYTFEYILVDEHQDSNMIQNKLLSEWCKSGNLFAVGDVKQSIYGFRGSDTRFFMNFDKDWEDATILHLDINYRSKKNIVEKANQFIKKYYGGYRHYSDAIAHIQEDGNIQMNTYDTREIEGYHIVNQIEQKLKEGIKPKEIAVLYRVNAHADYIENELRRRGIDYEITNDSSFFKRKEVAALIAYLRLIHNPHDDEAFEQCFKFRNYPLMYFSNKLYDDIQKKSGLYNTSMYESFINYNGYNTMQKKNVRDFENHIQQLRLQYDKGIPIAKLIQNIIKSFQMERYILDKYSNKDDIDERIKSLHTLKVFAKGDDLEKFLGYVQGNGNKKKKSKKNAVQLMSIHASKGLEFDVVYLVGVEDGKFPHDRSDFLEECRLFYVAVTRAKNDLYVSQIGIDNQFMREYFGEMNS
jgi:DNA helicase II / ATP-dependent DNA helicase PcrA